MEDSRDVIKKIRERTGLSRRDFCKKYGIPYQTVTDWELGHRTPPRYLLRFMAYYIEFKRIMDESDENELANILEDEEF